jgi:disulfide bond formation protein DsbB
MSAVPAPADPAAPFARAAVLLAILGVLGSLGLTVLLGLKPCPLCFYQRAFAMAALAMLLIGAAARAPAWLGCAVAVPMAVGGLGVAIFHVWLEVSGVLDCPVGFLGLGTAPKQSLGFYLALAPLVLVGAWRGAPERQRVVGLGIVLGLLTFVGSITANGAFPPAQPPALDPATGKPKPLVICVPRYTPPPAAPGSGG